MESNVDPLHIREGEGAEIKMCALHNYLRYQVYLCLEHDKKF